MEGLLSACVVAHDLAASVQAVFVGDQAVESDGAAGVELAGGDADFGSEAIAEAVREAGGAVAVDTGGIDKCHELLTVFIAFGDNRVGVVGAVAVDVDGGFLNGVNKFDCENQVKVLMTEVGIFFQDIAFMDAAVRSCLSSGLSICFLKYLRRFLSPSESYASFCKCFRSHRQEGRSNLSVDQKSFSSIAGSCVLGLGIDNDRDRLIEIGVFIDIDAADSVGMSHDRNLRVFHNIANKTVGTSRNQKIDAIIALKQFINLAVGRRLKQAALRKPCGYRGLIDEVEKGFIGGGSFPAALQYGAVAALDAETADLDKRIRSRFKDDPDDPDDPDDEPSVERPTFTASSIGTGTCGNDGVYTFNVNGALSAATASAISITPTFTAPTSSPTCTCSLPITATANIGTAKIECKVTSALSSATITIGSMTGTGVTIKGLPQTMTGTATCAGKTDTGNEGVNNDSNANLIHLSKMLILAFFFLF